MDLPRIFVFSWILCLIAYLMPWAEGNKGILLGFSLAPFTLPYLIGLIVGLVSLMAKVRKLLLAIAASMLMVFGVFMVIFYWYSLALHYGGVAKLMIGVWIALIASALYLLTSFYTLKRR